MQTKIVIHVEGGNVQSVYSSDPTTEVEVVDFDNLRCDGKDSDERDAILEAAKKTAPHEVR
jgi:hypothetical protein